MPWVMRILGVGQRTVLHRPLSDPCYLKEFDLDAHDGQGYFTWTESLDEAMRFESFQAVMRTWGSPSRLMPIRPYDGRPNKPLTALTITPEQV